MTTATLPGPDEGEPRDAAEVFDLDEQRRRRGRYPDPYQPDTGQDEPTDTDNGEDEFDDDDAPLIPVRRIVRTVARHPAYVAAGGRTVARRAWESRTTARHERMMRLAEAQGDHASVLEWEQRTAVFRKERHERRMAMLAVPVHAARAIVVGTMTTIGLLVLLGIVLALSSGHIGGVGAPLMTAVHIIRWLVNLVSLLWRPALGASLLAGMLALWSIGRHRGDLPTWLAVAADAEMDLEIDETTIARALEALRIPQITAYLKQGLPLQYLTTARADGRGTHAVIRLPAGVTAERIAKRRADLATGLYRAAKEVWPTTGSEAGILDLWVADKGALAQGAGPYPLLSDGVTDVFKGVPFGRTLRGDAIVAPLFERNTITGGMPGQGKSSAARAIMAGAALDPTCELRIWVPDSNFDFEAFAPRCSVYVMGAEDERIEEILFGLRDLHDEVQRRGKLLIRFEEPSVTRKLASRGVGLHPIVALLEEAHVAIQHPKYGKEISQLLIDIVKLGRKRFVHLIVSTQAPTKDSMPRDVTRNCSNGIAFAVGDHVANDALLGQGAYSAGHRATELIPGVDKGTAVAKGLTGERSEIVQVYFLDISRGNDQITPIITRSLAEIERRGLPVPGTGPAAREAEPESRDLLTDLDAALGGEIVPSNDVPALLRDLAPGWPGYQALTGTALREQLAALGIKVPSTGNRWPLDPRSIRDALTARPDTPPQDEPK